MENAINSNIQNRINRTVTDIRLRLREMTQKQFAELAGWQESKVSRLNYEDVATVLVVLEMAPPDALERVAQMAIDQVLARMGENELKGCPANSAKVGGNSGTTENDVQQLQLL